VAYQASITLSRAWLVDPLSPTTNPITCGTRRGSDTAATLDGEFRQFAGDRVQLVSRNLHTLTVPIVFAALTATQYAQVEAWMGRVLLLRTIEGGRWFGGYLSVSKKVYLNTGVTGTLYDATVQFTRVSYAEAV
jgi:hypothetical protein